MTPARALIIIGCRRVAVITQSDMNIVPTKSYGPRCRAQWLSCQRRFPHPLGVGEQQRSIWSKAGTETSPQVCAIDRPLSREEQAATCTHVFHCPQVSRVGAAVVEDTGQELCFSSLPCIKPVGKHPHLKKRQQFIADSVPAVRNCVYLNDGAK